MDSHWHQLTIGFADWHSAEHTGMHHLLPLFASAETEGVIAAWFFIRKAPHWRVRYQATNAARRMQSHMRSRLQVLQDTNLITEVIESAYEPETYAFGGVEAMTLAHRLWHRDSKHLMAYLTAAAYGSDRRRELSILLCTAMMRGAHLDWYEQGDVWARVADHRDPPDAVHALVPAVLRLMSVEAASVTAVGTPPALTADWVSAFTIVGSELSELASNGALHRGLRDVLAHHIIFAWNRFGLSATAQAMIATAAKTVVFGDDPARPLPKTPHSAEMHH